MHSNQRYALDPGFKTMLTSVGARHEHVLRVAGLAEDLLNRSDARVSADQFFSFLQAIEAVVDDPLLALRLAEGINADSFSPPGFAALCSPDMTTAARRLAKFKPLIAPVALVVESTDAGLQIAYDWYDTPPGPPTSFVGAEALFLVKLARLGTRHAVQAVEVTMTELPEERAVIEKF